MIALFSFKEIMQRFNRTLENAPYNLYHLSYQINHTDKLLDNRLFDQINFIFNKINDDSLRHLDFDKKVFQSMNCYQCDRYISSVNSIEENKLIISIIQRSFREFPRHISYEDYNGFYASESIRNMINTSKDIFENKEVLKSLIDMTVSKIERWDTYLYDRLGKGDNTSLDKDLREIVKWLFAYKYCEYLIGDAEDTKNLYLQGYHIMRMKNSDDIKDIKETEYYKDMNVNFEKYQKIYQVINDI